MVGYQEFDFKEFYGRQIALPEIGLSGQEKLREAEVTIVGLGGLGSVAALYLALAGIGRLRIVDQDTLELGNLHRQLLYRMRDLHLPKVEVAADAIGEINPDVEVDALADNLNENNAKDIVSNSDCVVDGLDNMRTRYILNRNCVLHGIPYVFAGAIGFEGNVTVFHPPETPCLECVFSGLDDALMPICETRGVLGVTAGLVGILEAGEVIKLLTGVGRTLKGKLLFCDLKEMSFEAFDIYKRLDCPVCSVEAKALVEAPSSIERMAWLCSSDAVNVNPIRPMNVPIEETYEILVENFEIIKKSHLAVIFLYKGNVEVSLFRNGRMLIKNVRGEEEATRIYNDVVERLKL